MPRPLRVAVANIPFHILNRGNNRQAVFKDEGDFNYFIDLLLRFKGNYALALKTQELWSKFQEKTVLLGII